MYVVELALVLGRLLKSNGVNRGRHDTTENPVLLLTALLEPKDQRAFALKKWRS